GPSERRIWRHRKKDGSLISVEVRASDLISDGKRLRLAVINDVTERERPTRRPLRLWIAFAALVFVAVLSVISTDRLIRTMERAEHSHELLGSFETVAARFGEVVAPGAAADAPQRLANALSEARHELSLDLNADDEGQLQHF